MTLGHLQYKDLRSCMLVSKFFQHLTQDPKVRSELFRGTVISSIISYYEFLVIMFLPETTVFWPPEGGWPNVTKENYPLNNKGTKTQTVIDIARYLPYVAYGDRGAQIYVDTVCVPEYGCCPSDGVVILPPSTLCIAEPPGRDSYYFFLDTERETITAYGTPDCWPYPFLCPAAAICADKGIVLPEVRSALRGARHTRTSTWLTSVRRLDAVKNIGKSSAVRTSGAKAPRSECEIFSMSSRFSLKSLQS